MNRIPFEGLVVVACVALSACAGSGPGGPNGGRHGAQDMEDGVPAAICLLRPMAGADGNLTKQQLDAGIRSAFAAADADHDGWLNKSETAKVNAAKLGTCDRSPLIDWSGTGRIGVNDFASQYNTAFQRADSDGDGVVTLEEMNARPRVQPPEGVERKDGVHGRRGSPGG